MLSINSDPLLGDSMSGVSPMNLDPLLPPLSATPDRNNDNTNNTNSNREGEPTSTTNNNTTISTSSRLTSRLPRLEQYKVRLSTQMRDEQELNVTHLRELVDFFVLSLDSYTHALYLSICEDYKLGTLSRAGAASMVFSLMQQYEGGGTSNSSTAASLSAMNSMTHTRMEERSTRELFDFLNGPLLQDLRREKQVGRSGDAAMLDSDENTSDDDVIAGGRGISSPTMTSPRGGSNLSTREDIRLRAQRSMEELKRSNNNSTYSMSSSLAAPLAATLSGGGTIVPPTKSVSPAPSALRQASRSATTTVDPTTNITTPVSPMNASVYPTTNNNNNSNRRVGAGVDSDCFKTTAIMWRRVRRQIAPSFNLRLKGLLNVAASIRFGGVQTTSKTTTTTPTPRRSRNKLSVRYHVDPLSANSSFPVQSSSNNLFNSQHLQNSGMPTVSEDDDNVDDNEDTGIMHDGLGSVDITMTPSQGDISLSRTGSHFDLLGGTHQYDVDDDGEYGSVDDTALSEESGGGGARDVALSMAAVTTTLTSSQLRASLMSRLRAAELRLKGMRLRNSQIKMSLNQARDEDIMREMADKRRQDKRLKMLQDMLDEAVRLKDALKSEVALSTRNGQYFVMHTMPLKKLFQEVEGYNAALQGLDAPDEQLILPWLEKWKRDGVLPATAPSPDGGGGGDCGGDVSRMTTDTVKLPPRTLSISDLVTTKIRELREESTRIERVLKTCVDGVLQHTITILDEEDPTRIPTHIAPNIRQEYASDYIQTEVDKAWREGAVTTAAEEREYRQQLNRDLSPERINWEAVEEAGYAARPSSSLNNKSTTSNNTRSLGLDQSSRQQGGDGDTITRHASSPSSSSDVLQRIRRLYALDPSLAEAEVSRLERQSSSSSSPPSQNQQQQQPPSPVNRRLSTTNSSTSGATTSNRKEPSIISDLNLFSPTLPPPTTPVSSKALNPSASSVENQARRHSLVMGHSGAVSQRLENLRRKMGSLSSFTTTAPPPPPPAHNDNTTRVADRSSSSIATGDPYFSEPTASTNISVTANSSIFTPAAATPGGTRGTTPYRYQHMPAYLSKMSLPTPQHHHNHSKRDVMVGGPLSDIGSTGSSSVSLQPDALNSMSGSSMAHAQPLGTSSQRVPTATSTNHPRAMGTAPTPTTPTPVPATAAAASKGARAPITNALLEQYLASRQQVQQQPSYIDSSIKSTTTAAMPLTTAQHPSQKSSGGGGPAVASRRGSTDSVERKLQHLRSQRQGGSQYQ